MGSVTGFSQGRRRSAVRPRASRSWVCAATISQVQHHLWLQAVIAVWAATLPDVDPDVPDTRLHGVLSYLHHSARLEPRSPVVKHSPEYHRAEAGLTALYGAAQGQILSQPPLEHVAGNESYLKWQQLVRAAADVNLIPGAQHQVRRLHDESLIFDGLPLGYLRQPPAPGHRS
ncbi:hypothetical protein ABIA39_008878 [Nocardia sp. GAS34]|uniref:hypothetical protein n=1 Tax=unclassified Nocardia TaxID=2637762 RepID=UPI003D193B26